MNPVFRGLLVVAFGNKWTMVLRNRRVPNSLPVSFRFHDWVRRSLQENVPYDQIVRSVLAASGDVEVNPVASWYTQVNTSTAQMEDTAQLFLGLRIQCARCHHHPFERWSQNDYYGFEAVFSQVGLKPNRKAVQNAVVFHRGGAATARNPRTLKDLKPTGLGAEPLDLPPYEDPRHSLVDWMVAPNNPFFARALVNRYWKHFFGRGIVDPEDDMRVTNPPSNPELLDALAKSFVDTKFDLKNLVRTICRSQAYQLSSEPTEFNAGDKRNFSSFSPRRMNAEPLYDAINQVAGTNVNFAGMPVGTRAMQLPDSGFNDYFLQVFGKPQAESACECERSSEANLAQSLHLLNSTDIQGKLSAGAGRCERLAADTTRSHAERITELYLWAFARPPRENELPPLLEYVQRRTNQKQAHFYCDGSSQPAVVSSATLLVLSAALGPVLFSGDAIGSHALRRSVVEHAAPVYRSITEAAMIETPPSTIHCCTRHPTLLGTLIMVLYNWLGRLASGLFKLAKRGGLE